jgi:hypothetical protein
MGALFNTPGTLAILHVLNGAYQRDNFATMSGNAQHIADLTGGLSTYSVCKKYRFIASDHPVNVNWKKWLDYFDGAAAGGGVTATQVRQKMAAALQGTTQLTYTAIEFFAVPTPALKGYQVSMTDLPDQENNGEYTLVITAQTPTIDQIP